jgi:hypothetical protein
VWISFQKCPKTLLQACIIPKMLLGIISQQTSIEKGRRRSSGRRREGGMKNGGEQK